AATRRVDVHTGLEFTAATRAVKCAHHRSRRDRCRAPDGTYRVVTNEDLGWWLDVPPCNTRAGIAHEPVRLQAQPFPLLRDREPRRDHALLHGGVVQRRVRVVEMD